MPLLDGSDPVQLSAAARMLAQGELLAFPTETVYGLGARADDDRAVAAIFAAKGRPADHPLIVHVTGVEAARAFAASWPAAAQALAARYWPGPLTLIVPRRPGWATAAAGGQDSVGLRCPDHPVALALLREALALGVPGVAGPSANRFGRVSPTRAAHVAEEFGPTLAVLDGGPCREGIESAIVDCTGQTPSLLRPGTLERDELQAFLGSALGLGLGGRRADGPRAPGTLASHYAPRAEVHLAAPDALTTAVHAVAAANPGIALGVYSRVVPQPDGRVLHRLMPSDPARVAHELFAVLRDFDAQGVAQVWVETPPRDWAWEGVRDRLERAATR
jgi:L-threonylcarbamoyladenylate synthase